MDEDRKSTRLNSSHANISSISRAEGSSAAMSFAGISVSAGSTTFSFPLVSALGLAVVMQTGVFVIVGDEMLGEKILPIQVTLLEPVMLPMSSVLLSSIQASCFIPW